MTRLEPQKQSVVWSPPGSAPQQLHRHPLHFGVQGHSHRISNAPPPPAPRQPFSSTPLGAGDRSTARPCFGHTGDPGDPHSTRPPVLRGPSQGPGTGGHGGPRALRTAERPGILDAPVTWPVCVTFSPVGAMRTPKHLTPRGRLSAAAPLRPRCLQKVTAAAILRADP